MANNQTNVKAINSDGGTFHVQHTSTDSPILPAANLAQLYDLDPKLVTFVVEETEKEAAHRRKQESRINTFIFSEKLIGVVVGALLAFFVFGLGGYLILRGHDVAGVSICGAGLVSIVALFVNRQNNQTQQVVKTNPTPPARKPRASKPKKLPQNGS
jgi:uncharacterized membrane protein